LRSIEVLSAMSLGMAVGGTAWAQEADRPALPFPSVAGEDGAHVLYTNPANLWFDRDAMSAAWYHVSELPGGLNSVAMATTGSGLGAGLAFRESAPGLSWWTLSSGLSLEITERMSLGSALHWHFPEQTAGNFVAWDLGLGWRPAPFLGIAGSVQNLGNPAPGLGVATRYDAGVAIRPAGDAVTLGMDILAEETPSGPPLPSLEASLRVRPTAGLWLRAWGQRGTGSNDATAIGASIEVHGRKLGAGVEAITSTADPGQPGAGVYVSSVAEGDALRVRSRTVAEIEVDGDYPYLPVGSLFEASPEGYLSLARRLKAAADDPGIAGILLRLRGAPMSFAQLEELRGLVGRARARGTPVVAYLEGGGEQAAYFLATACDRVYLHPAAELGLVGLGAEVQYFRGLFDLVGVDAQYARRSEYKSGPEPFTETGPTPPAREELDVLLDRLAATLKEGIASGRGLPVTEVEALVDRGPFTGQGAVDAKLVDGILYPDELHEKLQGEIFPAKFRVDDDYSKTADMSGWAPPRAIAVVVVEGPISDGESSPGGLLSGPTTGARTVAKQLRTLAREKSVKAVVLRVDSPGGSSFGSDVIWRAVEEVKREHKPVIVSMGGYAASGGYYVAAGADRIVAEPSTITGSIGVYGGKFSGGELMEKLGIRTTEYTRGRNAGMYSLSRPMDPVEYAALERLIGATYDQFKSKVAAGRSMDAARVEELARGRAWAGADAKERGLVDELGGFYDAVELARVAAGIGPNAAYSLMLVDPWSGGDGDVVGTVLSLPRQLRQALAPRVEIPRELKDAWTMAALRDSHVFAMMPYALTVK
jgi:protease-4